MIDIANSRVSLYIQIKNDLISRIKSGDMPADSKVPSERELSSSFGTSRGTAKQALQELEAEGYIERIPAKGSYVRNVPDGKLRQTNILLPFPEESISRELLDYANWAADTEVYRGMMASCSKFKARVTFQYFEDTEEKGILQKQIKEVEAFDGAVFMGQQLFSLKKELHKRSIPFVSIHNAKLSPSIGPNVFYNRAEIISEAANFLGASGYKRVGLISHERDDHSRKTIISDTLKTHGAELDPTWVISLPASEDEAYIRLKELLPDNLTELPDVFFCCSQVFSFAFLRLAAERNWHIPDDIGLMGYANNMSLRPTHPLLTHVHVPYYEMGLEACRVIVDDLRSSRNVPARLVKGETTIKRI